MITSLELGLAALVTGPRPLGLEVAATHDLVPRVVLDARLRGLPVITRQLASPDQIETLKASVELGGRFGLLVPEDGPEPGFGLDLPVQLGLWVGAGPARYFTTGGSNQGLGLHPHPGGSAGLGVVGRLPTFDLRVEGTVVAVVDYPVSGALSASVGLRF